MVSIILLLLYFNLYYEYCFTDACIIISRYRVCSCLRCFFKKKTRNVNNVIYHDCTETSKQGVEI